MTRLERTLARKEKRARRFFFWLCMLLLAASAAMGIALRGHDIAPGIRTPSAASAKAAKTGTTIPRPTTTTTARRPNTTSAPAPSSARRPLTLAAAGDVIGDRKVGAFIDAQGGPAVFASVDDILKAADLAFLNLESPLSDTGTRDAGKDVTLRGRPALVGGLRSAGIDVVSLANNHQRDWGAAALLDTIARLDRAGIGHAGAGEHLDAARRPAVVTTPGGRVAVFAFSVIQPAGALAGEDRAGINPGRADRERMLADVRAARARAEWVVVSVHWGAEYQTRPSADQRDLGHALVRAGADVVLGHHPHVLQGLEMYRGSLIAYSLGDFVFDHYSRATGETVILRLGLLPAGPPRVELVPVYVSDGHGIPAPVTGKEAAVILERMRSLSGALGTTLDVRGDRALVQAQAGSGS